ncbi:MAG TPA: nucleoside hydrolase [Nocardioidaceae bacterium]|nr:nucleoside hydrolase [Nocardioidaceae bacterium]
MPTPAILDCDPGHDDAVAILLANAHPQVRLLAITVVAGNQTLDKCTLNARRVCSVAGITEVPIAAGADRPLKRPLRVAAAIHGESGLDGVDFDEPTVGIAAEPAVDLMAEILSTQPQPVTLIATGPLTNVATLLRHHPAVTERIGGLVLMGGSTGRGNTTPYAEFNIHTDPEAAAEVWSSGLDITMVGLNTTHQARVTPGVLKRIRAFETPVARMCVGLLEFYGAAYRRASGLGAPPMHDPVAVARVIDPGVVRCVAAPVSVETSGEFTAGATVVDLDHVTGRPDNTRVAVELDSDGFWDLVVDAVGSYG